MESESWSVGVVGCCVCVSIILTLSVRMFHCGSGAGKKVVDEKNGTHWCPHWCIVPQKNAL